MSKLLLPFERVFLFERFTPKYYDLRFLLEKINEVYILERNQSLLMILKNAEFGYFSILDLNYFIEEGFPCGGNTGNLVKIFSQELNRRNKGVLTEREIGFSGIRKKKGYLATDNQLFNQDDKRVIRISSFK